MSLAITIPQSWPSREIQEELGTSGFFPQLGTSGSFLVNVCHSEGGCFSVAFSAFAKQRRIWLSVPSPCQPGKQRQEVITFLIEQIRNASSQERMADLPSMPPGPLEAAAMLRGAGDWGWPRDLGLLCPQTLLFGWGCICCGGRLSCNEACGVAVSAPWPRWHGTSLSWSRVSPLPSLCRSLVRTLETVSRPSF